MTRPAPVRIAIGLAFVLVGLAVGERSLASERLECERARGSCVLERGGPLLRDPSRTISLTDVASVEFRERSARGESVLRSPRGDEFAVGEDALAAARLGHARLAAFFAGEGERVEVVTETAPTIALVCAGLVALGLAQALGGALALRRGAPAASPATTRTRPSRLRRGLLLAVLLGALVLLGLLVHASYTRGTLVLDCEQRCEFAGGLCMPGQTREWSTTPGVHPIRVWDPTAPDSWRMREVTLVAGETTRFRCVL